MINHSHAMTTLQNEEREKYIYILKKKKQHAKKENKRILKCTRYSTQQSDVKGEEKNNIPHNIRIERKKIMKS